MATALPIEGGLTKKVLIAGSLPTAFEDTRMPNVDIGIDIAVGNSDRYASFVFPFVDNDTKKGVMRLIWRVVGVDDYTFLTVDTSLYISSTSVADVGIPIVVSGLDSSYNAVLGFAVLNGQSSVLVNNFFGGTPLQFFRINELGARGAGVSLAGEVYLSSSNLTALGVPTDLNTVKGFIANAKGFLPARSVHVGTTGVYTVPLTTLAGATVKLGLIKHFAISPDAAWKLQIGFREPQVPTIYPFPLQSGSSSKVEVTFPYPPRFLPGTDIIFYADMDAPNKTISGLVTFLLCLVE